MVAAVWLCTGGGGKKIQDRPLGIAALSSHHPSVIWSPLYSLEREETNSGGRILKRKKL